MFIIDVILDFCKKLKCLCRNGVQIVFFWSNCFKNLKIIDFRYQNVKEFKVEIRGREKVSMFFIEQNILVKLKGFEDEGVVVLFLL